MNDAVRALLDRTAIEDLMLTYAHAVDSRDFDLVASCFTPDVTGWGHDDRDSLVDFISGVSAFDKTMHMLGNRAIAIDGDEATFDGYAMLVHRIFESGYEMDRPANRYVEKLVRTPDGWQIRERGGEPAWGRAELPPTDDPAVAWLAARVRAYDDVVHRVLRDDEATERTTFLGSILIDGHTMFARALITEGDLTRTEDLLFELDEHCDPLPPPSDDPDVRHLCDRALIADTVARSAGPVMFLGNQRIEIDDDQAIARTYAFDLTGRWSDGAQLLVDELRRFDGGWTT